MINSEPQTTSGIDNKAISAIEAGGTTYPLLYAYTEQATDRASVKLTYTSQL